MSAIPVIDLAAPSDRVISDIDTACARYGFFQIVNHSVDSSLRQAFFDEMHAFFQLPDAGKNAVRRTLENPWGYYDQELTKNTRDWKQIYDFGPSVPGQADPQWPEGQDSFRDTMQKWYACCESISAELVGLICRALGLADDTLTGCFDTHTSFLRLNYYPACDHPAPADSPDAPTEGHLGINRHTDAGALTVLVQDQLASLQVRSRDGWQTVMPVQDGLIINVGDLFQVWSNDRYRAPEHRVLANRDRERFSAPFFYNPDFATNCQPLIRAGQPSYRSVNWGEFRASRAEGDYGDYGEEIQISDYRI